MYRRSKFNEVLLEIRKEMSAEADFDIDIFTEMARSGSTSVAAKDRKKMRVAEPERPANDEIAALKTPTELIPEG